MSRHTVTESEHQYSLQNVSTHNTNATLNISKNLESEWPQKMLTSDKEYIQMATSQRDIFICENLMWHSSASVADKGIGGVACSVLSDLYTMLPFSIGTAEGSTIFTRWRQCAHPINTLFLKPTWVSPLNSISISSAIFVLPTHWSRPPQEGATCGGHVSAHRPGTWIIQSRICKPLKA